MADELEQHIAERERRSPGFTALVEAAEHRRLFAREMAEQRKRKGLSQTQIAARMDTSASIVSRLESGGDVRLSTLEKYVAALGLGLTFKADKAPTARRSLRKFSRRRAG